jgi:hypothetical protein
LFNTTNTVGVSPDYFGTNIAALADRYNKYRFTKLVFEYVPSIYNLIDSSISSTLTDNQFAFGFVLDGQSTFTVNYGSITEGQHCMIVPPAGWKNRRDNMLTVRIPRNPNPWMWNLNDSTSSASLRQTVQGLFLGEALNSFTAANTFGSIWVHYTVQFNEMVPDQGFTLRSLMREAELGGSILQRRLHVCLEHAKQYGRGGVIPMDRLDGFSNEELVILTGKGRPPSRPMVVGSQPLESDSCGGEAASDCSGLDQDQVSGAFELVLTDEQIVAQYSTLMRRMALLGPAI